MRPDSRFLNLPKDFWAHVRLISQEAGYTVRGEGRIKAPSADEIERVMNKLSLSSDHISSADQEVTAFGNLLLKYFDYRADVLHGCVESLLMNAENANGLFQKLRKQLKPKCPIPMNKQKGRKRTPAFFTGIINMLIESNADGLACDYDPRKLTTVTQRGVPVRTLAKDFFQNFLFFS